MGKVDTLTLKQNYIASNYLANGYTADGEKPSFGFCETGLEKGMLGFGVAMPIWSHKKQIGQAIGNRSWTNFKNAYKDGARSAWNAARHPVSYWDLEFVNSKTAKLESLIANNTPQIPQQNSNGRAFTQAEKELFEKLCKAKDTKEFKNIIGKKNSETFKTYKSLLKHLPTQEAAKLKNVAKYNELYGTLLNEFKAAQAQLKTGTLPKGEIARLHNNFAEARYSENKWIRSKSKGKAGVGFRAKTGAKISSGTKKLMAASKGMRKFSRGAGKIGGALCIALSALTAGIDCISAYQVGKDKGEGWSNVGKQALRSAGRLTCEIGGSAVGQWAGAAIGQLLIPIPGVGAAIGGIVGSFVGYWAGSKLADNIPGINKSIAEEAQEEATEAQNKKVSQAIDKGDIETIYEHTAQFKEAIVDENGEQAYDENGNPLWQYIQISEDEKEQKEFEKKIASLDNYVETEATKRQRKAELEQQAAEARLKKLQEINVGNGYTTNFGTDAQSSSGFGPAGTTYTPQNFNFTTQKSTSFAPTGTTVSSNSATWQNQTWQNNLGQQYNDGNFYTFNPNNYTQFGTLTQQPNTWAA